MINSIYTAVKISHVENESLILAKQSAIFLTAKTKYLFQKYDKIAFDQQKSPRQGENISG